MTATSALTADLQQQVRALVEDLGKRVDENSALRGKWQQEHRRANEKERTAASWVEWRDDRIDQTAVAWVLTSVFIRFCEDNALVKPVWITGPGKRRQEALDAQREFFQKHPESTDREWLVDAIDYLSSLPATKALVDTHSALHWVSPSGDAATELLKFWRDRSDDGSLVHDLHDDSLSTRFLGDLYQELSAHAKDKYALLQTPVFVEEFILDRTLTPALEERPLEGFRMIDPTCGSGHFLLGSFHRLLDRWYRHAPNLEIQARVQSALDAIHGVDLNPFAVAIARFRLTVAALAACGLRSLEDFPAFKYHLAVGDSLIHGPDQDVLPGMEERSAYMPFHYATEDAQVLLEILEEGRYDAVVGNPPYIKVKDSALNKIYRAKFGKVCKGTYALTVPFMVQFFALAKNGEQPGWVGAITSNSFMKRRFGVNLIEKFLSNIDLRFVIDSEGAWIPGHNTDGTPTVIIIGTNQPPFSSVIRAVLSKGKRESREYGNEGGGPYWSSLVSHLDDPGWDSDWVTISDLDRKLLAKHPWSLSGGAAIELLSVIDSRMSERLISRIERPIGRSIRAGADEAFIRPFYWKSRRSEINDRVRPLLAGEDVRNWAACPHENIIYPYAYGADEAVDDGLSEELWPYRAILADRGTFSGNMADAGRNWWEYMQHTASAYATQLSISYAEVASHNHFALDRGGNVFKQTAPIIKLPHGAHEDEYFRLLAALNCSVACFWIKQNSQPKGGAAAIGWLRTYQISGTTLQEFPLTAGISPRKARLLDSLAREMADNEPARVCENELPSSDSLTKSKVAYNSFRAQMISIQEEMDWEFYRLYGLIEEDLTCGDGDIPSLSLGERAFEMAIADEESSWFSEHGFEPIREIPDRWPAPYAEVVRRRLSAISQNPLIELLERPEYKRRWEQEPWATRQDKALREWLLDRLEDPRFWFDVQGQPISRSIAQLSDDATRDTDIVAVVALWEGRPDVPVSHSLQRLLAQEVVPFHSGYRYVESGFRKREAWDEVWSMQRRADSGENVGDIFAPPKYKSADFAEPPYARLRGEFDVPKERFILYPLAARDGDSTPLLGWARWDDAQQALALAAIIQEREQEGWDDARLTPLVAGLAELQPWVEQWHTGVTEYGDSYANICRTELDQRAAQVGMTIAELTAWRPAAPARGRKKAAKG
jgi:hypothetical protein